MVTENRRPHLTRHKINVREERPDVLILCEGTKTEPNYFRSFRVAKVDILGEGSNTKSLVETAIDRKNKANGQYDSVWVVFDRDSFPASNIGTAFNLAHGNGIEVAFSNEAFEIWYILHFEYRNTEMCRTEYENKLTALLGFKYKKNDPNIYSALELKQQEALKNAKKLSRQYPSTAKPQNKNPYTSVYSLVEFLNKLKQQRG